MPFYPCRFALLVAGSLALATGCAEDEDPTHSAVLYVAAGTNETSVLAGFLDRGYGASNCLTDLVDRCYVTTCLDGGGVQTYVDGGEVDFKGDELEATLDTGAVEDAAGNEGPGLASQDGLPALADDEKVEITVHGKGGVPEFEGSVQMPPRLVLTAPELEEPACQGVDPESVTPITIDPSDDFKVTWSSEREDDIDILFMFDDIKDYDGDEDRERSTLVRCLYTADEGEAVIPEEVLGLMPSGSGSFTIRQIVKHAELADDWLLTLGSYWEMCSPLTLE